MAGRARTRLRARAIAANDWVCNSLPRERWMRGGRRGAGRSRAAERRRRAARCPIHLEARNALVARVGLLGLLAQDHGLVAAVDCTRRRLEAERGALRAAEPGRSSQNRRDQTHRRDTRLHGHTSAPPMRSQRTIALIVPAGTRFFGRQSRRRAAGTCYSQDDDATGPLTCLSLSSPRLKSAARSFGPTPADLAPASPASRSPRQSRASCAWPRDRSFAVRARALPRRARASAWDH